MKVALVYDRINKWGGAERVLLALHQLWPEAPIITSVYHPKRASWAKDIKIIPSWLNRVPFANTNHEFLAYLMPYVFESVDLSQYDVVLSVTSAEAKGVITKPHQLHISYLLTPTRYLWSHTHEYAGTGVFSLVKLWVMSHMRQWDFIAAQRPNHLIPISKLVAHRIQKYYRRNPHPHIYPPVDTNRFSHHPSECFTSERDYLLLVGRLVGYKKQQSILRLLEELGESVIIVGSGRNRINSKSPRIKHFQDISDAVLACLYHHAKALIFPQEEDFGIVALEAQAAGIPVIINQNSGAAETIVHGKTGLHIQEFDKKTLESAIHEVKSIKWSKKAIQKNAQKYSTQHFQSQVKGAVERLWQIHQT